MSERYKRFRVWMRSKPGFYEQYDGPVDVFADDREQAIDRAYLELQRGAFPDRGRNMWRVDCVEQLD